MMDVVGNLERVAVTHPFITPAVVPLKSIVELELTRRANDDWVFGLVRQMTEMMQPLTILPDEQLQERQAMLFSDVIINAEVRRLRLVVGKLVVNLFRL